MTATRFNPFSAEFRQDPYPMYENLRDTRPVHRTLGMWVLTRHRDVRTVLRDRSFSAGLIPELVNRQANRVSGAEVEGDRVARIGRLGRKSLVFTDNPDHARLRGVVNRVFTTQEIGNLRPNIEAEVDKLIQRAWDDGGMDAIADFAAQLPVTVLCDWMALPAPLREQVAGWTHDIRFLLEPGLMKAEDFTRVGEVTEIFAAALEEILAQRRARPGTDLISRLLAAETGSGDRLTPEELVFICIMCFVAGNETTTSLIGNCLLALLRHPAQAELLHDRPTELAAGAVAEALRYDCPLQLTKRLATVDVEIGDKRIGAGEQVLLCLGAANRDPQVFARPTEFDITREPGPHLAFGYGMHGCLGGALAQLQAEIAFDRLFRRPERLLPVTDELDWQDHSFIVRGLKHLPVVVKATS
ncbi:MAG TPA: cytochrome P450 [Pseudonocardiaceae bacterium]|jgi:hypothetical protein|nr:cytochrome P450 [Pseudonocardiaceae bacterium]